MIDYFASFKNPIIEENNDRNAHNEHFNKNMYIVLFNKICKRLSLSRYKAWGGEYTPSFNGSFWVVFILILRTIILSCL